MDLHRNAVCHFATGRTQSYPLATISLLIKLMQLMINVSCICALMQLKYYSYLAILARIPCVPNGNTMH